MFIYIDYYHRKNVTAIGKKAFYKCRKLKKIIIKAENLKSVGAKAFKKLNKYGRVDCADKKKVIRYKKLMSGKIGH